MSYKLLYISGLMRDHSATFVRNLIILEIAIACPYLRADALCNLTVSEYESRHVPEDGHALAIIEVYHHKTEATGPVRIILTEEIHLAMLSNWTKFGRPRFWNEAKWNTLTKGMMSFDLQGKEKKPYQPTLFLTERSGPMASLCGPMNLFKTLTKTRFQNLTHHRYCALDNDMNFLLT